MQQLIWLLALTGKRRFGTEGRRIVPKTPGYVVYITRKDGYNVDFNNYMCLGLEKTERGKEEEITCEPENYSQNLKFVGRQKNSIMKQSFMFVFLPLQPTVVVFSQPGSGF